MLYINKFVQFLEKERQINLIQSNASGSLFNVKNALYQPHYINILQNIDIVHTCEQQKLQHSRVDACSSEIHSINFSCNVLVLLIPAHYQNFELFFLFLTNFSFAQCTSFFFYVISKKLIRNKDTLVLQVFETQALTQTQSPCLLLFSIIVNSKKTQWQFNLFKTFNFSKAPVKSMQNKSC